MKHTKKKIYSHNSKTNVTITSIRDEIDENSQSEQQEISNSIANFNQKRDQVTRDIDALKFFQNEEKRDLRKRENNKVRKATKT